MIIVSFPRSGQNLLNSIFETLCESHDIDYSYCGYYDCCNSIPCKFEKMVSKNHDFDLNLKINKDIKYISLYREDPIINLEAYYRFGLKHSGKEYKYEDLILFINQSYKYYNNFINKWVLNKHDNILKVEYYELVNNPVDVSKKCFSHFFPNFEIKQHLFDELSNKEINVVGCGILSEIKPLHQLSDDLYNRLKSDLNYLFK